MAPNREAAAGMPTKGQNDLAAYVMGIMEARNLRPIDVHRLTGINRTTLTAIIKGRFPLGSERTRPTLRKLAEGLGVSVESVLRQAGLEPEPEPPPTEISRDEVMEMLRRIDARLDALGVPRVDPPGRQGEGPGAQRRARPRPAPPRSQNKRNPGSPA